MANEFKIKKGLIVTGASGGTVVDIQGSQGQLFSVTDDLSGSIFAVSDISGVPILDVNSSGLSTFDGLVSSKDISIKQTDDSGFNGGLTIERSANTQKVHIGMDGGAVNFNSPDGLSYKFRNNGTEKFTLDGSGNGTFVGITKAPTFKTSNLGIVINNQDIYSNEDYDGNDGSIRLNRLGYQGGQTKFRDVIIFDGKGTPIVSVDGSSQDTTFAGQGFSTATSSGDASSTLTTKGYVDGLITGATIYRGAWDPSGGGYGSPDLSGVTQTSGYYYICSAAGTAEPNGTGTEPDTWDTGDWVIYNDVSGTGQWQKIDNSSVLSGVGTGQTVALWEGAGSVTDSETLGNAPITVSGNNTTFAGTVAAATYYKSSGTSAVLGTNASGEVLLRPTSSISSTAQSSFTTTLATIGTDATFAGDAIFENNIEVNGEIVQTSTGNENSFSSPLNMGSNEISDLADPTDAQDAATKAYVDAHGGGLGPFLPLTAGSSYPLTDTLYVRENGNKNNGTISMGLGGSGTSKWSFLAGTHYNQATGSGNGSGSAGMAIIGALSTETYNKVYIGGGPYEINAATQIDFWTHSSTLSTAGGTRRGYVDSGGNWFLADTLWIDDADEYVGIGTTTPGGKLEVNVTDDGFDDIDVLRLKRTWATGSGTDRAHGILFNDLNSRMATIYADRTNSGSNYNSQLLFSVNSGASGTSMITPMVINNLGRVGIGTTNPGSKLEVNGGGTSTGGITLRHSTNQAHYIYTNNNYQLNRIGSSSPIWRWGQEGGSDKMTLNNTGLGIGTTSPGYLLDLSKTAVSVDTYSGINLQASNYGYTIEGGLTQNIGGELIFSSNNVGTRVPRVKFAANGNVGIGTTSPGYKLEVDTNGVHDGIKIRGANAPGLTLQDDSSSSTSSILIQSTAAAQGNLRISADENNAASGATIEFKVSGDDKMRILANGNIGIGTTTPSAKLDVQGTQGQLFSVTDDLSGDIFSVADISGVPIMNVNSDGTSYFDGNVGIGTNSPDKMLQVSNGTQTFSINPHSTGIDLHSTGDMAPHYQTSFTLYTGAIGSGSAKVTVDSSGNVGIGTTSPPSTVLLDLKENTASSDLIIGLTAATGGRSQIRSVVQADNTTSEISFHTVASSSTSEAMRITSTGNVGIGTDSPSQKLHVVGKGLFTDDIQLNQTTPRIDYGNTTTAGGLRFWSTNAGGEKMRITSGGNVGIGTTSPNAPLSFANVVGNKIDFYYDTTNSDRYGIQVQSSELRIHSGAAGNSTGGITFGKDNGTTFTERMRITNDGNVGIGTTSPDFKLDVISGTNNGIRISADDTSNSWKDIAIRTYVTQAQANALPDGSAIYSTNPASQTETAFSKFGGLVLQGRDDGNSSFAIRLGNGNGYATRMFMGATGATVFSNTVTATNFITSSDERLKENIKEASGDKVEVNWKTFELKTDKGHKRYGVIAQDLEKNHPEFVKTDNEGMKSVAYTDLLIAKIAELETRIQTLENN